MDLDDGYHCNGNYHPPSNTRVTTDTGCDAKECRLHFFVAGEIEEGEEIICNYGAFAISSVWTEFGL